MESLKNGTFFNKSLTGSNMEWQESYTFNSDGTCTKWRNRDGIITEINGKYALVDDTYKLSYTSGNSIVGSCTNNSEEYLHIVNNKLESTWNACDGTSLEYIKQ